MLGNWIKQTSTSTGTGNLTLAAVTGFPTFSNQFAVGEYFYYTILNDSDGTPMESGIGHMSDSTTLVRDKPLATFVAGTYNDNDPAAVTLAAGTKRVICSMEQGAPLANPINVNTSASSRVIFPTGAVTSGGAGSYGLVANTVYYVPFLINTPRTCDALLFRNTTTGTKARVGIYTSGLNGKPNLCIEQSADVSTAAIGVKTGALTKRRYKPGLYFVGIAAAEALTVNAIASLVNPILGGDANMVGNIGVLWESISGGWSALPTTANVTSGAFDSSQTPLVSIRVA